MITDSEYFAAGLIPPGYGLRARTRQERRAFDRHEKRSARLLRRGEKLHAYKVAEWEDWELYLFMRVAKELNIAWGNACWWAVKQECSRREHMAAWGRRHDFRSTSSPWKGKK